MCNNNQPENEGKPSKCLSTDTRQKLNFIVTRSGIQPANGKYEVDVSNLDNAPFFNGEPIFTNGKGFCSWYSSSRISWNIGECEKVANDESGNDQVRSSSCPYNLDCNNDLRWSRGSKTCKMVALEYT